MSCFNVWWESDLPWRAQEIFQSKEAEQGPHHCANKCLFSVVQSTSGVHVGDIFEKLYDLNVLAREM